jgi:murein hydrolase activator
MKVFNSFLLILFFGQSVFGQKQKSRALLEREKKQNIAKIQQVKKILDETQKERESTVGQIKAINEQIVNQESRITLAKEDIDLIKVEMSELLEAQGDLTTQLKALQSEYTETLYKASKNSNKLTKLGFLFSSGSMNQLFMRYKYLEQYTESRKQQLVQINKIGEMLKQRQRTLLEKKMKQQTLISDIVIDTKSLGVLKERQTLIVADLSKKETQLLEELEKSKLAVNNLNNLISSVITRDKTKRKVPASRREFENEREIALEKRNKKNAATTKSEPEVETAPETLASVKGGTKKNFGLYKRKLSWPVSGFISDKFGVKNHPVLKGLKIDNNGIDIQTSPNSAVHTVFDGVVLDISQIPGLNNVVAIQHGDYYTVYANLERVNVAINQMVSINQTIGTVANKDGSPEINFQIWHNFNKLNPEPWLGAK